jgi:hypothetical protein
MRPVSSQLECPADMASGLSQYRKGSSFLRIQVHFGSGKQSQIVSRSVAYALSHLGGRMVNKAQVSDLIACTCAGDAHAHVLRSAVDRVRTAPHVAV